MNIEVNGTRLYYIKKGEGEPIILVHGNGESHKIFNDAIEYFSKNYTVYALDMRGQGASQKVNALHYEDMADDIIQFVDKNKIHNPYYFGFSDGGIVGLIAASIRQDIFRKMLLAGTNSCPQTIKRRWRFFFKLLCFFSRDKIMRVMFEEPNISASLLKTISTESVLLMGQRDVIAISDGEFMAQNLQNGRLVVLEKEGHASYVFNNAKLSKLMEQYLLNE